MRTDFEDQRKAEARRLRSSGLTYREIARTVSASLETLHRWCKDISPQTDKQTLESPVKGPNEVSVKPSLSSQQTNGRVQTSASEKANNSLSVWLLVLLMGLVVVMLLTPLFKDKTAGGVEESEEEEGKPRLFGYDGRSIEDL